MKAGPLLIGILVLTSLPLHMGVIRKKRDPILETQTDAVSLKQRLEELKDGEKGAPTPSFKFYEKADFQQKAPVGDQPEEMIAYESEVPSQQEVTTTGDEGLWQGEDSWWTQDWDQGQPAADGADPAAEAWTEDNWTQ